MSYHIADTEQNVAWLLDCYRVYSKLKDVRQSCEADMFKYAETCARREGKTLSAVLRDYEGNRGLATLMARQQTLVRRLEELSSAILFDTPEIWLKYKYQAYAGTARELRTLGSLREHCSKVGYICTKRFSFLSARLRVLGFAELTDRSAWPDELLVSAVAEHEAIRAVMNDEPSLVEWCQHEYFTSNGRSAKWGDVLS